MLSADEPEGADHSQNVCPECGYRFKGRGFDGIDAHWRAKHEAVMPYGELSARLRSVLCGW